MYLEMYCVSCKENKFKNKTTGEEILFYNVFVSLPDGDIAKVNRGHFVKPGDIVKLVPAVKDGFLALKVLKEEEKAK